LLSNNFTIVEVADTVTTIFYTAQSLRRSLLQVDTQSIFPLYHNGIAQKRLKTASINFQCKHVVCLLHKKVSETTPFSDLSMSLNHTSVPKSKCPVQYMNVIHKHQTYCD